METKTIVEIRDLSTGYSTKKEEKIIGAHLNGELKEGDFVCLLGPNGSGKSTLLKTLSGLQGSIHGEVIVQNILISNYKPKELSKVVSVVLTDNSKLNGMNVYDVVSMGRSPYTGFWGQLKESDHGIVEKCMQWVGVSDLKNRQMGELSDGERQKVMIAKSIAQETPIILLDEPTAFLDYPSKVSIMLMLHRLAKSKSKTILLSTHDIETALRISDRIWLLEESKGLITGIPEDLCKEGYIDDFFVTDGVFFDKEQCSFHLKYKTAREVLMTGNPDSIDYQLARRALIRNGIKPIRRFEDSKMKGTQKNVIIDVPGNGSYRMLDNGVETLNVNRIEHILNITTTTITKNHIQAVRDAANMTPFE